MVLESLEHAISRGATPIVEISGYGSTADAYHITQPAPEGEGAARAMNMALNQAQTQPEEIGYINAHGTSTPLNDKYETMALKTVFGEEAYKIPISSTKSMTGHLAGRKRGVRGGSHSARVVEVGYSSHHQPRNARPGVRSRLHSAHASKRAYTRRHEQFFRFRRTQRIVGVPGIRGITVHGIRRAGFPEKRP